MGTEPCFPMTSIPPNYLKDRHQKIVDLIKKGEEAEPSLWGSLQEKMCLH